MAEGGNKLMTVDEFLAWTEGREGRWELEAGALIEKSPRRAAHAETQATAAAALKASIRRAGASCHVAPEGAIVRIAPDTAYEPDGLVYCGPRSAPDAVEIREPTVAIEVISEITAARDRGVKVQGYLSLPSVAHYLILDPERRAVSHYWRGAAGAFESEALTEGPLRLDPPGLALFVEELFAPH